MASVKWLRLWGTTNPDGMYLRFKSEDTTDGFAIGMKQLKNMKYMSLKKI